MSDYVFVALDDSAEEGGVDLPLETDGTLLLSVLRSQFKDASGLKYRSAAGGTGILVLPAVIPVVLARSTVAQ